MRIVDKRIKVTDGIYHCRDCDGVFGESGVNRQGYCDPCWRSRGRELGKSRYVANQKTLTEATQRLADEIAKRSKNTALSPEFFDAFAKELGGARGLGERLAEDFKRLHGEGLDSSESQFFVPDEKTIQRYWQNISQFMQTQDKMNAVDISSLSDQELQATLLSLATGLIKDNPDFRKHVVRIAVKDDREFLEELAIEAGIVKVIEGSVASSSEGSKQEEDEIFPEDIK